MEVVGCCEGNETRVEREVAIRTRLRGEQIGEAL